MDTTRREALVVAAATVTLPMLQSALNATRSAAAQAAPAGGQAPASAPAEKPGWFTTKLKASDLKDNEFTAVEGHPGILVTRAGSDVSALSSKCTHKGCTIKPAKDPAKTITCACHKAQFNLDGSVAKAPATAPLARFAIRIDDKGMIEIDPGQTPTAEAKEFKVTIV